MSKKNYEFRPLDRDGFCRMCHRNIYRNGEKVFVRYHWSLKQSLILCQECVMELQHEIEGFVVVSQEDYESLQEDADWLRCLENAGVDNWEGCDFARELYREEMGDEL